MGHSLGGMAGPVILSESDRFDGFISLAGSLRSFSDIIMDQFEYLHQTGHVPEEQLEREEAQANTESRGCEQKKREEARAKAESRGCGLKKREEARAKAELRGCVGHY